MKLNSYREIRQKVEISPKLANKFYYEIIDLYDKRDQDKLKLFIYHNIK